MTIDDLEEKVAFYAAKKEFIDGLKDQLRRVEEECRQQEQDILAIFNTHCMDKYFSKLGTIYKRVKFSVKTPKTEDDRKAFFDYLKTRGMFDDLISVNSQTLNAWYQSELQNVKDNGGDFLEVPGLNEITTYENVILRKG